MATTLCYCVVLGEFFLQSLEQITKSLEKTDPEIGVHIRFSRILIIYFSPDGTEQQKIYKLLNGRVMQDIESSDILKLNKKMF